MKIHERHFIVEAAKAEMGRALINAAVKHGLTEAETMLAITHATTMMVIRSLENQVNREREKDE